MTLQLINDEQFTNIQRAQAGLTRIFKNAQKNSVFYRIMRNDQPLGVLVPNNLWQSITEDIEALSSPNYRERIKKSRKSSRVSAAEVKKILKI